MSLSGATDADKLKQLCTKTHKEQVIWFLNAFWHKHANEAELLWKYQHKFAELDLQNHEAGADLDELNAHRFLEFFNETMTVKEMRDSLRSTGAISAERFKNVPISHYLIHRFKADWKYLVNAAQGDNKEEIEQAQRMLEAVQAAFKEADARAREANAAFRVSEAREAEARAAQDELEAALAELKAQEDAYNKKKADLERKTEEGGAVARNKAKAELAQLLAEDPLPLKKAKITAEAAVRKAEKATIAAAAAVEAAITARGAAEEATRQSEAAKAAADAAVAEAEARVAEAEAFLNEVKSRPGQAQGAIWWIEREIQEARNYLPESKGGVRRR